MGETRWLGPRIRVIGAGLAGCEAAWQAAQRGVDVLLCEMKPAERSAAHVADDFAELVCSNSLRSNSPANAVGLLKEEMRRVGSLFIAAADATAVPAGQALAVDRAAFARHISRAVAGHPRIEVRTERVDRIPDDEWVILATGPLTASALASDLAARVGRDSLYFYDAISPIVYADSLDASRLFRASRYSDGPGDYLNAPLDRAGYEAFVEGLLQAESQPLHACEAALYFEGCLPIEEMARRGPQTLAHGPMKPVGLIDPRTGRPPHAVVQLRHEDAQGTLFNLVGFQTRLRIPEQKRLLRSLPGLEQAVFARFGSVHRNTYLDAPRHLLPSLELRGRPGLFVAGQIAGVEGYVESAALGFVAGVHAAAAARGLPLPFPPVESAHGALLAHLGRDGAAGFQPMNVHFGLFPDFADVAGPRAGRLTRRARRERCAERALAAADEWAQRLAEAA